ncbi:MAG: PKD domain-containing protein [Saprospirales bacterium]|nr:PKD domain-containing protein [Saprospirales bacterium]
MEVIMKNSTFRWAIALVFSVWCLPGMIHGQRSWEVVPTYQGLEVRNNMLVFSSKAVFDQVYQDLEQRVRDWNADANAQTWEDPPGETCPDDNSVLALFEQRYQPNTIRKATLQRECDWLNSGRNPADFTGHHLVDEILASLFSASYQAQVGTDIYYLPQKGITYIIANADLTALKALERGENPYSLRNVTVHGPEIGCLANFSTNMDNNSTTVGFTFTGEPQTGAATFFWEFGDGSNSMQQNPTHTYSQAGTYTVCVTVEVESPEPCLDRLCREIEVGTEGCLPFFIYNETGLPGGICFLDNTNLLENVISWVWEFGDGSPPVTTPNPCHTFPCDKTYFVTLTVVTSGGCTSFYGFPVVVDSYDCCASKAEKKDHQYYSSNSRQIKYHQYQLQIPLLYYRVIATVKNYKLNSNGNWKKEAANLKNDIFGAVFLPTEAGCKCDLPFQVATTEIAFAKKSLTTTKKVGKAFKAKQNSEWGVKYTVNNALLTQQTTPVLCD